MDMRSHVVEAFPLTIGNVIQDYIKIPVDASGIFYHYTTHAGLEGILKSGGLRATYRMKMNDSGEFEYARNVIYDALQEIVESMDVPKGARKLAEAIRGNLEQFPQGTTEMSTAYCACFTISSDHSGQWKTYAENGKGFAIGFDFSNLLNGQVQNVLDGQPHLICLPVMYDKRKQRDIVCLLVNAAIRDLQSFVATCSRLPKDLTALGHRITREIMSNLLAIIDFIKDPSYSNEKEMRMLLNPNDSTMKAPRIDYFQRGSESIPFIFLDLRNPRTNRLPLTETRVGPQASFPKGKIFLENLLDELGYGSTYEDRPRIIQSFAHL